MTRPVRLDQEIVDEWLSRHVEWTLVEGHLVRELRTRDYSSAAALVYDQVSLAERLDHHPILTLGYREVRVELWTHDCDGITQLDLDYAEGFEELVPDALGGR